MPSNWEIVSSVITVLLGLVAFFGGVVVNSLVNAVKDLRNADKALAEKFDLYVRREDLSDIKHMLSGIFERLDDLKDISSTKPSREEMYLAVQQNNERRCQS